jgi:predicted PurR-regulated permease PerM
MTSHHAMGDRSGGASVGGSSASEARVPEHGWLGSGPGSRGRLLALGGAILLVLWLARGIVGPFVVAAVVAYAFTPVVSGVQERTGLPRALVIAIGYVIFGLALAGLVFSIAHAVDAEIRELSTGGQDVIASAIRKLVGDHPVIAGQRLNVDDFAKQIHDGLQGVVKSPSDALHVAEQALNLALQMVLSLIVTFYFLLDGHRFGEFALRFLDQSQRQNSKRIARRIQVVLGRWLRGQILLIGLVAAVMYVILGPILHVPYALLLALLSGVLEIIPLVGPLAAASLAGTVAFATRGTDVMAFVLVAYIVVRQIEDQIAMPLVIGRAVHLHPVVTIFAVLVGLSAFGILGGLLGVPVAAALNVTLRELYPEASGEQAEAALAGTGSRKVQWVAAGAARVGEIRQAREAPDGAHAPDGVPAGETPGTAAVETGETPGTAGETLGTAVDLAAETDAPGPGDAAAGH